MDFVSVIVKICGLSTGDSVTAALDAGADEIGFVFYPRSPRAVSPAQAARLASLAEKHPRPVARVGLFVDADDAEIEACVAQVPLEWLQLHGTETPERAAAIRRRFGLKVMKAIKVRAAADIADAERHAGAVDRVLFDAPPRSHAAALPGGNGIAFDWRLLAGHRMPLPWMLSGGLNAGNIAAAVAMTGTHAVDVSSGVESAPGIKDAGKIREFLNAARALPG